MFAVTERLLLRPGWIEDAPALTQVIGDRDVARHLAHVPWPYSEADAEAFLSLPQDPARPRFLICLRSNNQIVGGIGLNGDDEPNLGYWIARAHWGRGYATEAGRAVLALADASLRLPQVKACHALDNPASGTVLRKLGFRATGRKIMMASAVREAMESHLFVREREDYARPLAA